MPPLMRGRGRGKGAPNDHEAGPSHRRTPSGPHNSDARDLWRSFTEPARRSVSLNSSPSRQNSYGPQSENEPHHYHHSYMPLLGHISHFHFSSDHAMGVDEDTDPVEPPTRTPNHPVEISDGSPFRGTPYNGPNSYEEKFRQINWAFTPSYHSSPLYQPQQQDPSEDSRFVAVTPPPPPPRLQPPSPPRRRRTNARISARGGVRIGTPPLPSGSRHSSTHEEPEMGGPSHRVSEVGTAPVAPQPPLGFGNPIPAYTGTTTYNPFEQPSYTGYNYAGDPYWLASSFNAPRPEGPYGGPWAMEHSTYGYPSYEYQHPQPPQPPHYQQPPQAPAMSPPQMQEILHEIQGVRQEMRQELRIDRRHNRGMFRKVMNLIKGKSKKDH